MTMYSERHPVMFSEGLHNAPLYAMRHLGLHEHGLTIDGIPPTMENHDHLSDAYKDPNQEVEIAAHNGDPQTERDVVHIGKYIMQRGKNPWPNAPGAIPPERLNQAANYTRSKAGLPQEGPMQIPVQTTATNDPEPPEEKDDKWEHVEPPHEDGEEDGGWYEDDEKDEKKEASFSDGSSAVMDEMTVESNWRVVSLGELQQPGGVGATQDNYNPIVDGPNPDGPNFMDNAGNSHEQEVALQTWVNLAIDGLNRGQLEDEIVAQLAHDGCPDPQAVLQRAMQENAEQPVSNEAGQEAFDLPVQQEPQLGGNDSVTLPQQNVYSSESPAFDGDRVLVRRTNQRGTVLASFLDTWGDGVLKIALDSGKIIDADPRAVTALTEIVTPEDPLAAIQEFLDAPEPLDTRSAVEARIDTLAKASLALHEARLRRGTSFSEQIRADKMKSDVDFELSGLRLSRHKLQESDFEYLDALPTFKVNAFSVADGERPVDNTFNTRIAEDAAILVSELPDEMVADAPGVELTAFHHASANYASDDDMDAFLIEVERRRVARLGTFKRTASAPDEFVPNDGPAEDLFY